MSSKKKNAEKNLDEELSILRELIKKENDMLRRMISSLDSLEKKMIQSEGKKGIKQKKS